MQKLTPSSDTVAPIGWERPRLVSRAFMTPSVLEEQRGDQRRPARLVTGAETSAVVPVEVFMEWNAVAPVRVRLEVVIAAPDGASPAARRVAQEDVGQSPRE